MIAWPGEVPGVLVVGWRSLDRTSMPRPFGVVALISADQTPLTELDWTDFAGVPGWWTGDTTETNKSAKHINLVKKNKTQTHKMLAERTWQNPDTKG